MMGKAGNFHRPKERMQNFRNAWKINFARNFALFWHMLKVERHGCCCSLDCFRPASALFLAFKAVNRCSKSSVSYFKTAGHYEDSTSNILYNTALLLSVTEFQSLPVPSTCPIFKSLQFQVIKKFFELLQKKHKCHQICLVGTWHLWQLY